MIVLAVHLHQSRLEVAADLGEHGAQAVYGVAIEDVAAVFGHEDQMDVHQEDAVPAVSNGLQVAHRPTIVGDMKRLQAYRYELMPDGDTERRMRRIVGACRFVWNRALALQKARYEAGEKKHGYAALCKELTTWRNAPETAWLADAPIHPLQQTLKDLERAYTNFFEKRAAFPRFRRRGDRAFFRYPDPKQFKVENGNARVFLPKLGWQRVRLSRPVLGTPKNITVSQACGRWYVSIQTERKVDVPVPNATTAIGIDVGIARFATMSDGSYLAPLNSFRRHEARLRRYQRAMSRKVKFSRNWTKAKARVAKLHTKIARVRQDYLHKATTTLSEAHALIAIEDLQVKNMSRSAAGTTDAPGRNVAAKTGLNKAILDQGWFEFRRQLDYKLHWNGGMLIAVPPRNTSRMCPCCGHVSKDNRTTRAKFECVECGYANHADVVGAINILAAGHAAYACGGTALSGRPMKQEPTEATTQELARA